MTARFSVATRGNTPQGVKRGADENDDERLDMARADDDPPTPPLTPVKLEPGGSSSSVRNGAGSEMVDASDSSNRLSHMEVVRRKLRCKR